ncbi:uncharacterized protein LOC134624627 isoform X2 [Pelmatolapia mariae]|uniref:uncharacterized protein LOC134624627 isoform X2 n=1 Tax=Pelmatolapia mariae TaxID=158779 RepID=UPI002FE5F937
MSSVQFLREFIKERLTAVCEEIFSEVQKTIVQYEEEINRQHRLLDISRKPDRNSHIIDLPQNHDCEEEEGLDEQQVCNQERNSSLDQEDPEPPQVKEEQEELCSSKEVEQLGLKHESEDIIVWTDEEQLRLLETICKPEIKLHRIGTVSHLQILFRTSLLFTALQAAGFFCFGCFFTCLQQESLISAV